MLDDYFVHDCTITKQVYDEYSDLRDTGSFTSKCWFREISSLERSQNREVETSDAMAWFKPSEDISEGDLLAVQSQNYRIMQIVKARKLGRQNVEFLKCFLERSEATVS